jgi:hypothetical protein
MDESSRFSETDANRLTALLGLMQWVSEGKWLAKYMEFVQLVYGELFDTYGFEGLEDIEDVIGTDSMMVQFSTMEEFAATCGDPKRNPIDEFLHGPGKSLSVDRKAYLHSLKGSLVTAYEIVEVGEEMVKLMDLFRKETISVGGLDVGELETGDVLVSRKLTINGETSLGLGILAYPAHGADELIEEVSSRISEAISRYGQHDFAKRAAACDVILSESASLFLVDWLDFVLTIAVDDTLPENSGPQRWFFPLEGSMDEVLRLMNASSRLRAEEAVQNRWRWLPLKPGKGLIGPEEGAFVRALIQYDGESLTVETETYLDAHGVENFLYGLLGDLVGEPLRGLPENVEEFAPYLFEEEEEEEEDEE